MHFYNHRNVRTIDFNPLDEYYTALRINGTSSLIAITRNLVVKSGHVENGI